MQLSVGCQCSTSVGYCIVILSLHLVKFLLRNVKICGYRRKKLVRILHGLAILLVLNPDLVLEIEARHLWRSVNRLGVLALDKLRRVEYRRENRLDGVAALHHRMVVVLQDRLGDVDHRSLCIICDAHDEVNKLLLVCFRACLKLNSDVIEYRVLV